MIQPGYYQSINTRIPLIDRSQNIMYHGIVKILRHDRNMGIFRKGELNLLEYVTQNNHA